MVPWPPHRMGEPLDVVQEAWRFGFENFWLCERLLHRGSHSYVSGFGWAAGDPDVPILRKVSVRGRHTRRVQKFSVGKRGTYMLQ
jgi:hypothetical protein